MSRAMTPILQGNSVHMKPPRMNSPVNPKKAPVPKPSLLAPPSQHALLIVHMPNRGIMWWAGPAEGISSQNNVQPIFSCAADHPIHRYIEPASISIEGFQPNVSGTGPPKGRKWPEPPPLPPPPKPRPLKDYGEVELLDTVAVLVARLTRDAEDDSIDSEELMEREGPVQARLDEVRAEIIRRLGNSRFPVTKAASKRRTRAKKAARRKSV